MYCECYRMPNILMREMNTEPFLIFIKPIALPNLFKKLVFSNFSKNRIMTPLLNSFYYFIFERKISYAALRAPERCIDKINEILCHSHKIIYKRIQLKILLEIYN